MARKPNDDQQAAVRASLYFFLRLCHEQRVRIRKDMAAVIQHAWNAVRLDTDGPVLFDDAQHKQRSNLILPDHVDPRLP
jgi:hypothetical protein